MERVSIVIPAHNEEKRIRRTLESYCSYFEKLKNSRTIDFEILVVLNACIDTTLSIVQSVKKKFSSIRFLDFADGGKGFAIKQGFLDALKRGNTLIDFVDADMATSPKDFYDLVNNIGKFDGIIASRWLNQSVIKTPQTFLRKITSRGFNFLTRIIFFLPYNDTQCGAKLFKRGVIEKIAREINLTQWAFDVNLLHLCRIYGFKIKEFPTTWEDRDESKLNLTSVPFKMFLGLVRLRLIYSPFKNVIKIYNSLPKRLKVLHQIG